MSKITELHESVYDFLIRKKSSYINSIRPFVFTLRIENKSKKLDKGYWFYGEEKDVIVSFWSGTDWRYDTPNIYLRITTSGDCSLNCSYGDSSAKGELFRQIFEKPLQLSPTTDEKWVKYYPKTNYLSTFDYFLENDKQVIDHLIDRFNASFFTDDVTNSIGFIDSSDFEKWLSKITDLRDAQGTKTMPYALTGVTIENFKPIKKLTIGPLPKDSPFIFLTGNNGSGKTSILRALAYSLALRLSERRYDPIGALWQITANVLTPTSAERYRVNFDGIMTDLPIPKIPFCSYGALRLDIDDRMYPSDNETNQQRMHPFQSLFSHDAIFKDLNRWIINSLAKSEPLARERYTNIKKLLTNVIPNLRDIREIPMNSTQELHYFENDTNGNEIKEGVNFRELSSGIRSLIVMLGDMMIRLFEQQPDIEDISRLTGIVLIDEIDIHLHPKWQREVPKILSDYFPYVQFIVTTHSPIPLLGAPKNSRLLVIKRDAKDGVTAERLDHVLDLGNLLPNTILTSPIFGFDDIIPESNSDKGKIRTERSYKDLKENDRIRNELRQIAKNIRDEKD